MGLMLFQAADELGEVIQSAPPVDQIEEGNFDDSFSILLLSEENAEEIQTHLLNISEISEVVVSEWNEQETHTGEKLEVERLEKKKNQSRCSMKNRIQIRRNISQNQFVSILKNWIN